MMATCKLTHATAVDRRPRISLEALAQIGHQRRVRHELAVAVGDLVGGERLQALGRRDIGALERAVVLPPTGSVVSPSALLGAVLLLAGGLVLLGLNRSSRVDSDQCEGDCRD